MSKSEKDKAKQIQDKCQAVLNEMLRDEDNKYCVDCDSKGPRWASWNLGVFLCIRCAGIHRNLGVHISKVKSVNLDSWTPEQVVSLQQMGNSRARAVYEANLPDNFRRPQSDSSLESFVRAKYEHKKYIAREWVPPVIPKVDWEKEIDEEIERQKRKKKAVAAAAANITIDKKTIKIADVPQIPKPKTSSPKPSRTTTENKTTQDLLGLQNGEDGFTGFLSAPPPAAATATAVPAQEDANKNKKKNEESAEAAAAAVKAEEESFFNQPAPTEKEKTKLTKDSILALYANTPQVQPQPVMYNVPQSVNFPQQVFAPPTFGAFPQQQQQQQQQQFQQFQQSPFMGAPGQFIPTQFAQFPNMVQYPQMGAPPQQTFPAFQPNAFTVPQAQIPPQPTSNPFFGSTSTSTVQQQFSTMSLGAAAPKPSGATVAMSTNLWQ